MISKVSPSSVKRTDIRPVHSDAKKTDAPRAGPPREAPAVTRATAPAANHTAQLMSQGNTLRVRLDRSLPPPPPATGGSGPATTLKEADKFHITQWGEPGKDSYNTKDSSTYGKNDCGPTSGVVALAALGKIEKPSPENAMTAIDGMRDKILGKDTQRSQTLSVDQVAVGLQKSGVHPTAIPAQGKDKTNQLITGIDSALGKNHPVVIQGAPMEAWGNDLLAKGDYLNPNSKSKNFGHIVAITGKTADGKYIISDPLNSKGPMEVTREQLAKFIDDGGPICESRAYEVAP